MAEPHPPLPSRRPSEAARLVRQLGSVLAAGVAPRETLTLTARAVVDELDAGHCTISLLDGRRLRPAAAASRHDDGLDARFVAADPFVVSGPVQSFLERRQPRVLGQRDARKLVPPEWANDLTLGALALVPACFADEPVGLLTVDWPHRRPRARSDVVREPLGSLVGLGIHHAAREGGDVSLVEELQAVVAAGSTATELVAALNDLFVRRGVALRVLSIRFILTALRHRFAAPRSKHYEIQACERGDGWTVLDDDTVVVGLWCDGRLVGTVRARVAADGPRDRSLLSMTTFELAQRAHQILLVTRLVAATDETATIAERYDIIRQAQADAAHVLATTGQPTRLSDEPPSRVVERQLEWAAQAAELVPSGGRKTLQRSLRSVIQLIRETGEVKATVEVRRPIRRLDLARQRLLYRATCTALSVAWTIGRSSEIRVELVFEERFAQVTIQDNGYGLGVRGRQGEARYEQARRPVARTGGSLRAEDQRPRGVKVVAVIPVK